MGKQTAQSVADWAESQAPLQPFGRPPSLTTEVADAIGRLLLTCTYPAVAARALGINERTFERWKSQGRSDDEADIDSIYAYLCRVLDQKEAEAEVRLVAAAASGKMGWQGPMTVVSRRHRTRWADEERQQAGLTIQIGGNAQDIKIAVLSPLALKAIGEGQ